jgi:3-oxoacyl-[acyl-carrier protein] reductase
LQNFNGAHRTESIEMKTADTPTAIVTGAGAGIGRAIASELAREGHRVAVLDRNGAAAEQTCIAIQAAGGHADALALDITDPAALDELAARVPQPEILVNNAGIFSVIRFDDLTPDDFRRSYEINVVAMFALSQRIAANMRSGGRIVNICSRAALGSRHYAHYVASKAAVAGLTRAMALDLAERDITVNAVAPGVIETDMLRERSDTNLDALRSHQPNGRLGKPEDIAHAVAFLASPRAAFINGQILLVDGGRSIGGTAAF